MRNRIAELYGSSTITTLRKPPQFPSDYTQFNSTNNKKGCIFSPSSLALVTCS